MKQERHLYVVYDIKEDATRSRLAKRLAYYGLRRVQYSVFNGIVTLKDKEAMLKEINAMDLGEEDKIHVIDLCEACRKEVLIIGRMPDVREHIIL